MILGGGETPQEQHTEQGVEIETSDAHHYWHEITNLLTNPVFFGPVGLVLVTIAGAWATHKWSRKK